jgi:uncharacterized protein YdiU (UPF0061 family)
MSNCNGLDSCFGFGWRHHSHHRGLGRYCYSNQPQIKEDKLKSLADYKKALEEELQDVKGEEEKLGKAE